MKNISIMLKPASSACDMRCRYCFYADEAKNRSTPSYGKMSADTAEAVLKGLSEGLKRGDTVTFAFQGGEPTLAGLDFFVCFTEKAEKMLSGLRLSWALQTNALSLDDAWCVFLREKHFLTGVSYDMLPEVHDRARVDAAGGGTSDRVLCSIENLRKHRAEFNILSTLTPHLARHPRQVWNEITRHGFRFVQFTPCLGPLEEDTASEWALTPKLFASFYEQLYSDWLKAFRKGDYYSVKLFDDWIQYLAHGVPFSCGQDGNCQPQLIVEADGSVYPCDFYCLDECRLGSFETHSLKELVHLSACHPTKARAGTEENCGRCAFGELCAGGCRRMRGVVCFAPGGSGCGLMDFLSKNIGSMRRIAMEQRRLQGIF